MEETKIRLAVIVSDFGAAANITGARVETRVRTFDLSPEAAAFILRERHEYSTVFLAIHESLPPDTTKAAP